MVLLPIQTGGLQDKEVETGTDQEASKLTSAPYTANRRPMNSSSSQLQGHQLAGARDSTYTVFCAALQYLENKGKLGLTKYAHVFKFPKK